MEELFGIHPGHLVQPQRHIHQDNLLIITEGYNLTEDWNSSSSSKMCPEYLKNCHCPSIFLEKQTNKQKLVNTDHLEADKVYVSTKNSQFNEKKKSIIIVILLQRALTDLLDSSPPFWSTTLSWSLWCDVSFDCVLNHLVKLSGSPYADGLLCVSQLVTSDLSEYVLTIMAYSEIVQILPPE